MKQLISSFLQRGICLLLLALPAALLSAQTTYEIYPIPHQIAYGSQNLHFTEEDVKYLEEHGYVLKRVGIFDNFPQSVHVECIALMSKVKE